MGRNIKIQQEKEIKQLIEVLAKLFPEMRDVGDLFNSEVLKILENLIEKQNNIKNELENGKEILKNKEEEIVSLKNHISKFNSQDLEKSLEIKEKSLKEMNRKF